LGITVYYSDIHGEELMNIFNASNTDKDDGGVAVLDRETSTKDKEEVRKPPMYKVIILNDPITPFQIVVEILSTVFRLNGDTSVKVMLAAHMSGSAVVGIYPFEIAETKVHTAIKMAESDGYPLNFTIDKEHD